MNQLEAKGDHGPWRTVNEAHGTLQCKACGKMTTSKRKLASTGCE